MAEKTFVKRQQRFEKFAFPKLGSRPVAKITVPEFLAMRYAIATVRAGRDITADLRGALAPVRVTHHPAIIEPRRSASC